MKKYKEFLISPLIVLVVMLVIYLIKGIYPFGKLTIANGDMGQSYMPIYYYLYDIFFNGKSIFYDITLGMGSNMYGVFSLDGLFNPTNLIILLNSRENIPYMFSFLLIIKIMLISLTSYILFYKMYKNNKLYNVIFSVIYAFSGYVLTYNTNIMWLDVVGLFPLFIIATKYMFETNKIYWYSIVLALILISNYNLAYMVLMFIIFIIPIYIFFEIEKEKRKRATFNLIIGTICSVGLSAFTFVPSFFQTMSSYRMSTNIVKIVTDKNFFYKIVIFIFYTLPLYGYFKWFKYIEQDMKKIFTISLSLMFSAILPILLERINLLWHGGSYQSFPFRYGFIPTLILYMGALRYFSKFSQFKINGKYSYIKKIFLIFILFSIILGVYTAYYINISMLAFVMNVRIFSLVLILFVMILLAYIGINSIKKESTKKILICALTMIQVLTFAYAYIGVPEEYRFGTEWSDDQIFISNELYKNIKIEKSMYKIKDLTASTTENCSLVYDIPSRSTFLHIIPKEQVLNCIQMGYSARKTQINDFGGTILSDAIYGIKYVLSKDNLSDEIYNLIDTFDNEIKLYQYKKSLPTGITYLNDVEKIPEEMQNFEAQNYLYINLFNKNEDIINLINDYQIEEIENGRTKYTFYIKDAKELYIYTKNLLYNIKINGKEITIPTINNKENKIYTNKYCNGILDLGYFENCKVELEYNVLTNYVNNKIKIGILDIEKYNEIFDENYNDIKVETK